MLILFRILFFVFSFFAVSMYYVHYWKLSNVKLEKTKQNHCHIPSWNRISTLSTSHSYWNLLSKWLWMYLDLSNEEIQNDTSHSILAAYVYPNSISVSLISQHMVKQEVYCRYYDCEREEIPESAWLGVVFPESVVECPRRIGAEFVSVSRSAEEEPPTPVRLTFRAFEEPVHELSACVAPLYGDQPSWLPIADFIEHNKLEGVHYFYFYVGEISDYDDQILNDYVRTGDVEVVNMQDKYQRVFIGWHFLQIQDCHLRSKYHSKWTAFIDLDERISTNGQRMIDVLRSIEDPFIGEVQMQILSVIKDQDYPDRFLNKGRLEDELIFKKYNETVGPEWKGMKTVIRSDKVGIMSIHSAVTKYPGITSMALDPQTAVVRHFRSTKYRIFGSDWHKTPDEYGQLPVIGNTPLSLNFSVNLREAVVQRVLQVYAK
uniref:Glycosyltransferase family 92 protein n=3 Tax=Caenorhabditis tropicalis TaxID=1561998 RepID=A0A1I7TYD2_9PELO